MTSPNAAPKFHVIAIRAGAGSRESLKKFFDRIPSDFPHSFVIVSHLSPDDHGTLADDLFPDQRVPCYPAEQQMELQKGAVYLIPPRKNCTIEQGKFRLHDETDGPDHNFFRSLADDQGERAIVMIVSGEGSDGSEGLQSIKQSGGVVMVQSPSQAKFDGMPQSAVDSGLVDHIAPIERLPYDLRAYIGNLNILADAEDFQVHGEVFQRILRDTSERLELQDRLQSKIAEQEQFAYIVSHDLQEPLRTLTSFSGLLLGKASADLNPDNAKALQYIQSAAQRMNDMVSGMLKYSRLDSQVHSETGEIDCNRLLREVLTDMRVLIEEKHAVVDVKTELPTVKGAESALRKVFQNLLTNSLKFQPEGQAPQISVEAEKDENSWIISVSDNGIGFDSLRQSEKLFQLFQKLNAASAFEGTGIGLASCKKIIELHGGQIWADSSPGKGSTFSFSLPRPG